MQNNSFISTYDEKLDLVIERLVQAARNNLWRALTEPQLVKQWFCPKPWQTVDCRVDLRVGGEFFTVMQSPEGQEFPGASCIVEIVPGHRLIWTSSLKPGFRPSLLVDENGKECATIALTCVITLEDRDGGTYYKAHALHANEQQKIKHEAMGFHEGWGTCLTQLVEVANSL